MGNLTPNMSIFEPDSGEELYAIAFSAGLRRIDAHDHSGAPDNGVPIGTDGIQDGAITPDKLSQQILITITATTTSATPVQAVSIPVDESSAVTISGEYVALRDTATESTGGNFMGVFHRTTGGVVALVGLQINNFDDSSGAPTIDLVPDTLNNAISVECIGESAKTINWKINYNIVELP